jgi:hypothetical protein
MELHEVSSRFQLHLWSSWCPSALRHSSLPEAMYELVCVDRLQRHLLKLKSAQCGFCYHSAVRRAAQSTDSSRLHNPYHSRRPREDHKRHGALSSTPAPAFIFVDPIKTNGAPLCGRMVNRNIQRPDANSILSCSKCDDAQTFDHTSLLA